MQMYCLSCTKQTDIILIQKKVIRQSVTEMSRFLKQKSNTKSNEKVIRQS